MKQETRNNKAVFNTDHKLVAQPLLSDLHSFSSPLITLKCELPLGRGGVITAEYDHD